MNKISIENLKVSINEKDILKNINFEIKKGDIIAILGPNGNGKSTLLKTLMKHYSIKKESGNIFYDSLSIDDLEPSDISKKGVFFAPQHSEEISGVLFIDFLKAIVNSHRKEPIKISDLFNKVESILDELKLDRSVLKRYLNYGFSGGEKKKSEILQLKLLNPDFILLDEIDSGLDVDSLNIVINQLQKMIIEGKTLIIVSHQQKIFDTIKPTKVLVMINGEIALEGDYKLLEKINIEGYEWIKKGK